MRLLFIRHGEPNYELDCLTDNGVIQAQKLRERLEREEKIDAVYLSPMGRAQQTGRIYLEGKNIPTTTCDWLREFNDSALTPGYASPTPVWDWYPKYWTDVPEYYDNKAFADVPAVAGSSIPTHFKEACEGLDAVLAEHGLVRTGNMYTKTDSCDKTLAFFCHFGITCAMIAHLLGVSPVLTLQGLSAEPTAIAVLCTDDRFDKQVNFRLHSFGDIHHLGDVTGSGVNYK